MSKAELARLALRRVVEQEPDYQRFDAGVAARNPYRQHIHGYRSAPLDSDRL